MVTYIKQEKTFLLALFVIALLVRGLVFTFYLGKNNNFWQIDSGAYHETAVSIAQGRGISSASGEPQFHRLPGYSLFLAAYYKIFGIDKKNVLWPQIFLASFIPFLIFLLSMTLFPTRIFLAKCAALYSAFHIGLVLYAGFFMTESLFIVLFLLFALLFFSDLHLFFCRTLPAKPRQTTFEEAYLFGFCPEPACSGPDFVSLTYDVDVKKISKGPRPSNKMFGAGLLLGVASLVRPVGHYFIVLCLILVLVSNDYAAQKLRKCFLLFAGWLLMVLPWLIRNYVLLGSVFFHTLPGGHFLNLSAARIAMHVQKVSYWQARKNLNKELKVIIAKEEGKKERSLNPIERCKLGVRLALTYFATHPFLALKNWLTDMLRTTLSLYSAELVFLESGRKHIDYFRKGRSVWSMFARYLFPEVKSWWLQIIIWLEIALFTFIVIGFFAGLIQALFCCVVHASEALTTVCIWLRVLPIMLLFIVLALAGGYARMRLPVEPFLIIFSLHFWTRLFRRERATSQRV